MIAFYSSAISWYEHSIHDTTQEEKGMEKFE